MTQDLVLCQFTYWRRVQGDLRILTKKGGGLWQPDAELLRKLRREIDRRSTRIKQVLTNEPIRKAFLGGVPDDEKKVVKAFIGLTSNASTALKRHPKVKYLSFFCTHSPIPALN
jgi:uncharacterized protein (DUF2461 family)